MFKFIHTADIHLDSPLKGLEAHEDAPVDEIRGATRRAFDNLINLALDEEVNFILIAGDLYDGDWKDYNTGLFFVNRMGRLQKAGIKVFIVSGNHDAAGRITKSMPIPDNVKIFSHSKVQAISLDELGVIIHGRSYTGRAVTDNLAAKFPRRDEGYFNIGLLHTSLTGRAGHEDYAPCSLDDLKSKGYDYWALGHVHQREIVAQDPWIVFPGNIQGRHIRETGPKGATLVTVDDAHLVEVAHYDLDVLRWEDCHVDLSTCETTEAVYNHVRSAMEDTQSMAEDKTLAIRLHLEGSSPLHGQLLAQPGQWTEEFRGIGAALGNLWLEKVKFKTKRQFSSEEISDETTPLAGLMHTIENLKLADSELTELIPELANLKNKIPVTLLDTNSVLDNDPEKLAQLLPEVKEMLIAKLIKHGAGR